MSKIPDLQAAVRALEGVAHAAVRWPEPEGPATLRVEFSPGADREEVTERVLTTMREVGGVDLSSLELQPLEPRPLEPQPLEPQPGEHTAPEHAARPVADEPAAHPVADEPSATHRPPEVDAPVRPIFSGLTVDRSDLDSNVTVRLEFAGRSFTGSAAGLATRRSTPRTAAAAALAALRELLPPEVRVQLDWLEVVEAATPARPVIVHSAVSCLTSLGEETFVGSAIAGDDLREAAVRATLDALNRRLYRPCRAS